MTELSLKKVEIDGFRGLRHLVLDELGLINVLVGGNNSGKTSVLEALSILCDPMNPHEWMSMAYRRDFGGLDETRIQSLRWCFPQNGELFDPDVLYQGECEMRCLGNFPLNALRVSYQDIIGEPSESQYARLPNSRRRAIEDRDFEEGWRGAEITHYVSTSSEANQLSLFGLPPSTTIEPFTVEFWEDIPASKQSSRKRLRLESKTLTPYSYQINRLQVRSHSKHLFKRDGLVLQLIQEFDPDVNGIEIASFRGGRPALYLSHEWMGPAPLSVFGDALRRAVLLASTLPTLRNGGILLIDEVETGIHVSALAKVFRWLVRAARDLGVQVFATTHSLEAVDALVAACEGELDDIVSFHLHQEPSQTECKRYSGDLLHRLRNERGLDVR